MPLTERVHFPLLLKISVSSANDDTQTLPKLPELAIIRPSRGACASPLTEMVRGPAGSSLSTVIVANLRPKLIGSKQMGIDRESPAPTNSGKDSTCGTKNSAEEEVIPLTDRVLLPWVGNRCRSLSVCSGTWGFCISRG